MAETTGMPEAPGLSGLVVAVDLGGTFTKIALADSDGGLHDERRLPTWLDGGPGGVVRWLAEQISAAATTIEVQGFGVVVPGIVDALTGTVRAAPNIGWYDVSLLTQLRDLTGLDGAVAHDVRSGGLAEWRLGAGRGVHNLIFLPLGTGIASAVVVDGRLLEADGYAGELGHIPVPAAAGVRCACGAMACLESVASAAGVRRSYARLAMNRAQHSRPGAIPQPLPETREIAGLVRAGDDDAQEAFSVANRALGEALVIASTLFGPELIIIGGGLGGALDLMQPALESTLESQLTFQRRPRIVAAQLGAQAGVIGAGLVGWDRVSSELTDDGSGGQ